MGGSLYQRLEGKSAEDALVERIGETFNLAPIFSPHPLRGDAAIASGPRGLWLIRGLGMTSARSCYALLWAVLLFGCEPSSWSEDQLMESACGEDCKGIEVDVISVLGGEAKDGYVSPTFNVASDRHRIYLVHSETPHEIRVYDRLSGAFQQAVGREGEGPSEYRFITNVDVANGDSLYVFDPGNRRLSVLDPYLDHVRGVPLDMRARVGSSVQWRDGNWTIFGPYTTADAFGFLFHELSSEGRRIRSFGGNPAAVEMADFSGWDSYRWLAQAGPSHFWAAHFTKYQIERWSRDGQLVDVLTRQPGWFSQPERELRGRSGEHGGERGPQEPRIIGVLQKDSLLFVVGRFKDEDWEGAVDDARVVSRTGYMDSMMEVLDARTGELLAMRRFDSPIDAILESGDLLIYVDDPSPRYIVARPRIVTQPFEGGE